MKYTNTHIYIHVCLCVWYVCYDCFIMQNQLTDPMILASLLWFSLAHSLLFHALWHRTLVPSSVLLAFLWIPPTPATTLFTPPGVKRAPESHWSELIWSTEIWAAKPVVVDTSWEKKPLPRAVRTLVLGKIPEWNTFSFPSLHGFSLCIQTAGWNLVTDMEQSNI